MFHTSLHSKITLESQAQSNTTRISKYKDQIFVRSSIFDDRKSKGTMVLNYTILRIDYDWQKN